jgi:hypothetical protein
LLEVPLSSLAHPETIQREVRALRRGGVLQDVDVPYFAVDGEKVWGATAMVLAEFVALVATADDR